MPLGRDALVGDLEHCFYDFPETVGKFHHPNFSKVHDFSEGLVETTSAGYRGNVRRHGAREFQDVTSGPLGHFRMTIRESKVAMGIPVSWSFAACISLSCLIFWVVFGR